MIGAKTKIENKSDYMMILVFLILFAFALISEFTDLFCEETSINCTNCGDGLSGKYIKQKPTNMTTKQEAIQNVKEIMKTSLNYVSWRKYFITTSIIIFIIFMYKQNLTSSDLLVMFIGCLVTLQLISNFYRYHYEDHVTNIIMENMDVIQK